MYYIYAVSITSVLLFGSLIAADFYEYSGESQSFVSKRLVVDNVVLLRSRRQSTFSPLESVLGGRIEIDQAFNEVADVDDIPMKFNDSLDDETEEVDHKYYVARYLGPESFDQYWMDVDKMLDQGSHKYNGTKRQAQLSSSYRRAVQTDLPFDFPFYGHMIENITIATGGFMFLGEHMHSWLAATQYIAPLMANFDTTNNKASAVKIVFNETVFVVEWHQVPLRDQNAAGNFTFQVVLNANGDIHLLYKTVPIAIKDISDANHPRKIGLSDAYLLNLPFMAVSRRVIYEYHRVEINDTRIGNNTAVILRAEPVCIQISTCNQCTNASLPKFNCTWCAPGPSSDPANGPTARERKAFCSDDQGLNRMRQEWLKSNCDKQRKEVYCTDDKQTQPPTTDTTAQTVTLKPVKPGGRVTKIPAVTVTYDPKAVTSVEVHQIGNKKDKETKEETKNHISGIGAGGVIAIIIIIGAALGIVGWGTYAYRNPQTPSGQFLIRVSDFESL